MTKLPDTQVFAFVAYTVFVLGLAGLMMGLSYVLGGRATGRAKHESFESGVVSTGTARLRLSAKFYLVAMFFVIFDLEAVFLYAWAVTVRQVGWQGYIEAAVFIIVLLGGLVYLWRLGALQWSPRLELRHPHVEAKRL